MLAQQWQNHLYTFLQDNLKRQQLPSQNLNYRTVVRLFSMLLSADVAKTMNVAEMQQLYYLAETIKLRQMRTKPMKKTELKVA